MFNDDGSEGTQSYAVGGLITNPCVKISWSLTAGAHQPDDFITTGHQYPGKFFIYQLDLWLRINFGYCT